MLENFKCCCQKKINNLRNPHGNVGYALEGGFGVGINACMFSTLTH